MQQLPDKERGAKRARGYILWAKETELWRRGGVA